MIRMNLERGEFEAITAPIIVCNRCGHEITNCEGRGLCRDPSGRQPRDVGLNWYWFHGLGSTDFIVVQVKTRDWPGAGEMERLQAFKVPANCKKLIHRWRDRQRVPDVRELA